MSQVIKVREVTCKTALSPCGLPLFKYSLNPYRGCQHGCAYCYSPAILREKRPWGAFVDVKINIPTVLAKELRRKERGVVWLGSVCDAYQPIEGKFGVTRLCLEELLKVDMPVSLLTKSSLIERDLDLISSFSDFELGFSLAYGDDSVREQLEPGASTVDRRLESARMAAEKGLEPWVFIAPIVPGFTDRPGEIGSLIGKISKSGVKRVGFDSFRPRPAVWPRMRESLGDDPELMESLRMASRNQSYYEEVALEIQRECERNGVTLVG
jgi:DNA repair photolyase